jgi:hypothetical protein
MNKHTIKRLDAFLQALSAVRSTTATLAAQTDGADVIAKYNQAAGNVDGALATQVAAIGHVSSEYPQILQRFAAYITAIKPVIPIARALREAAGSMHRNCDEQPILIDPDADYGKQLFGAAI